MFEKIKKALNGYSKNQDYIDDRTDLRTNTCPNCESSLEKIPERKTKCKSCGEYMYVKTNTNRERVLVDLEGAERINTEWNVKQNVSGIELLDTTKKNLKEQFGKEPSKEDIKWRRFNLQLESLMKENDFWALSTTYYEMANFVESEGMDPKEYRDLGYKMKKKAQSNRESLLDWQKSKVVTYVEVMANDGSCQSCKSKQRVKLLISDALRDDTLPREECTYKYGCRCTYLPVVDGVDYLDD